MPGRFSPPYRRRIRRVGQIHKSPEDYFYMKSYCPYTNLERQNPTPPCSSRPALNDSQVMYWEPAKVRRQTPHPENRFPIRYSSKSTWVPATAAPPAATTISAKSPLDYAFPLLPGWVSTHDPLASHPSLFALVQLLVIPSPAAGRAEESAFLVGYTHVTGRPTISTLESYCSLLPDPWSLPSP